MQSQSAIGTAFPKDDIRHLAKATSVRARQHRCLRHHLQQHFLLFKSHSTTSLLTASARPRFRPLGVARLPPLTPPQLSGLHLHGRASANPYQQETCVIFPVTSHSVRKHLSKVSPRRQVRK